MNNHNPSPARRRLLWGGLAAAGAASAAGVAYWLGWRPGQPAPADENSAAQAALAQLLALPLRSPSGEPVPASLWAGRPLLINFWATWCPPCVREMPELDRFWREHQQPAGEAAHAARWQVLGLALDQPEAVQRFLTQTPVGFPVALLGLDQMPAVRALGNAGGVLPFSVAVSAGGDIRYRKLGALSHKNLLHVGTLK